MASISASSRMLEMERSSKWSDLESAHKSAFCSYINHGIQLQWHIGQTRLKRPRVLSDASVTPSSPSLHPLSADNSRVVMIVYTHAKMPSDTTLKVWRPISTT